MIIENKLLFTGVSANVYFSGRFDAIKKDIQNLKEIQTIEPLALDYYEINKISSPKIVGAPSIKSEDFNLLVDTDYNNWQRTKLFKFYVKYDGFSIFHVTPTETSSNNPTGNINFDNQIEWLFVNKDNLTSQQIKDLYESNLNLINKYLENLSKDCEKFNSKLLAFIKTELNVRKNEIEKDKNDLDTFGYDVIK